MSAAHQQAAVGVLLEFFTAMNEWETFASSLMRRVKKGETEPAPASALISSRLADVQQAYCSLAAARRTPQFQTPPEYDLSETVLDVEATLPDRILVTTQQATGFGKRCQYELISEQGAWKVNAKWFFDHTGKLTPLSL